MARILQVVLPARFGGIESVVHALAAGQRLRGHDVHVATLVASDTELHNRLRDSHVPVHVIKLPPRAYLREMWAFRKLCRALRPDIVHAHGQRAVVFHAAVASHLGVPTVLTSHGLFDRGGWKERLTVRLEMAAFRRCNAVVAVSRAEGDELCARGVPHESVFAIPNAWYPTSPFLPRAKARHALGIPDAALVAGWVGRVSRAKALDVAMAAVARLGDVPVVLSIIGDGEERDRMEEYARVAGIADRLTWHGARLNAHELMRAFDLFVLSSVSEGLPIVLLEAMAAGIPVVATAVGGVPEVVSVHEAILVPPEDPRALADGIRNIIADPDRAARRVEAARCRIRDAFGIDAWLDRHDALYERLISRRRRGSWSQ